MNDYECSDRAGDAAAYVLGSLDAHEEIAFASHLVSCVVCRDEMEEFGQVVDLLALAPPQYRPSRRLKRSVMRDVRLTETGAARPRLDRARLDRHRQTAGRTRAGIRLRPGLAGGLAAGVVALALAAAGLPSLAGSALPNTRTISAQVHGVDGSASLRVSGGHAELIVNHFSAPASGEIYEVWKKPADGKPQATKTLFSVLSSGAGVIDIPGSIKSTTEIMVTQEPAGGSPTPTSNPVIVARLA